MSRRAGSRSRREWLWFGGLLAAFVFLVLMLWVRIISVRSRAFEAASQQVAKPVRVMPVKAERLWKTQSFLARVEGARSVDVRAETEGWVREKRVDIGDEVEAGQVLLVLGDERVELGVREAEGRLQAARADLAELTRKLALQRALLERGIVAADAVESLRSYVASKRAQVRALEAAYERAVWERDHMTVRSEISGTVVDVVPDVGQRVARGEVVARVVDVSLKRVVAGVDLEWARRIEAGQQVEVVRFSGSGAERVWKAVVVGVGRDIDPASGTYKVEARIVGGGEEMWPGEVVVMRVPVRLLVDVVKVPRSAVMADENGLFVFALVGEKALKVPVEVTWLDDETGAVPAELLPAGAKIIYDGNAGLTDGERVRVVD